MAHFSAFPLVLLPFLALSTQEAVWATACSVLFVAASLVGCVRWFLPMYRRTKSDVVAARDSLLGRDEVRDSITNEVIKPSLPGIGVRMESQEKQMAAITTAVAKIAESHVRLENHDLHLEQHDKDVRDLQDRVDKLEKASVERIVSHAESAAAFRAIEAAQLSEPPIDVGDTQ